MLITSMLIHNFKFIIHNLTKCYTTKVFIKSNIAQLISLKNFYTFNNSLLLQQDLSVLIFNMYVSL